jgi:hypothetical protein
MSQNKSVSFRPWTLVKEGKSSNAYSRGSHNNRASRAQVTQQFAQAGMPYSKNARNIAYVAEYNNVLKGMRGLTLKGGRRRSTRRKTRK